MKIIIPILLFIVLSFTITTAQPNEHPKLSFNSGYAIPAAPSYFTDYWNSGISLGAGYQYPLFDKFSAVLHVQFTNFMFDADLWKDDLIQYLNSVDPENDGESTIVNGGMKDVLCFSLNFKYDLPMTQKISSYVLAGGGAMYSRADDLGIGGTRLEFKSEWASMGSGGIGLEYSLREDFSFLIEGSYVYGATKQENNLQLPIDLFSEYEKESLTFYYLKLGFAYNL